MPIQSTRRLDIEGLRALAVLSVLAFHIDSSWMPGGYLGVDVFFVISGFLIIGIILRDLSAGNFSFGHFYERRVRRIVPPLVPVLGFTYLGGYLLFLEPEFVDYAKSAIASALQVSNLYFMSTSGYFDSAETVKPLLHTWSLSIEEQFYLLAPLCLFLLRGHVRLQGAAVVAALAVSLCTYAAQTLDTSTSLDAVFYNTLTRVWQIAAGGVVALAVHFKCGLRMPPMARLVALLGLAGVLCWGAPTGRTLFDPRYLATFCAVILVWPSASERDVSGQMLALRPLQFIGSISYGLYLWHWPLLVFAWIVLANRPAWIAPTVVLMSFAMATASFHWLERPTLRGSWLRSRGILFTAWSISVIVVAMAGAFAWQTGGIPQRLPPGVLLARAGIEDKNPAWDTCFRPPNWEQENIARLDEDRPCLLGKSGGPVTFILAGDSHANSLMPLFDTLARDYGITGVAALYSGCPPLVGVDHVFEVGRSCSGFNEALSRYIARHDVGTVFMVAFWNSYLRAQVWDGPRVPTPTPPLMAAGGPPPAGSVEVDEVFSHAISETLERYAGRAVVVLGQTPPRSVAVPQTMVQAAILRRPPTELELTVSEAEDRLRASTSIFKRYASESSLTFVDPVPFLCSSGLCEFEINGRPLYYDDHHPSSFGSMHLRALVEPIFIRTVLP